MSSRQLLGQRTIITGASSGLGAALALHLAEYQVRLVINSRTQAELEQVARAIRAKGGECHCVIGDIADARTQENLLNECCRQWGGVDCLINNAAVTALGRFDSGSPERLYRIFDVNFFAAVNLIRRCLPELKAGRDPLIVNISSVLGHRAIPLKSEYCASKFALHGFSDALRAELVADRVQVLLVSPSTIRTRLFEKALEDSGGGTGNFPFAQHPDKVARQIAKAMIRRKHELIVSCFGKFLVIFDRLFPKLANHLVARFGQ